MADNTYGVWIISFLLVGILGMAFLTTINDAITTSTTPTSVSGETLTTYGENTVANTPLHAVTSVYTSLTLTAYTDYIVTLASNLINLNTTQADTLELIAPHAEAAGYWSFNVNNSTNTVDDANGLNNGTLNPGSDSIINETFNSSTYDAPVQLAHTDLVADSVFVTTVDGETNYTETTNYTIDYSAGTITTLSTGDMAENTDYYIDYNYSESYPIWTDAGQYGGAYEFDGVDDYINCGNDSSLNVGSDNFTLSVWYKTTSTSLGIIAGKGSSGADGKRYLILVDGAGTPRIEIDDNTTAKTRDGTSGYNDGNWHNYVGVRDGNSLRLYLDGIEQTPATDITGYGDLNELVKPFAVGIQPHDLTTAQANGTIDEPRVYNRSLSADEIKEIYDTYMNTSIYKADYTYEQSGYTEGTGSTLLWLIPTFLLISLLLLFWRLAEDGA